MMGDKLIWTSKFINIWKIRNFEYFNYLIQNIIIIFLKSESFKKIWAYLPR
jgi:hypothetical protein